MDWRALIEALQAAGVTQQQIAEHCEVKQSTVSDLKRGSITSPSFNFGTRLVDLHKSRCGKRAGKVAA